MDEHDALGASSCWQHGNAASEREVYCQSAEVAAGGYGVLQFETGFPNALGMIETVTPMLDKDGKWKVLGYFVKRGRLAFRQTGRTEGTDLISTS